MVVTVMVIPDSFERIGVQRNSKGESAEPKIDLRRGSATEQSKQGND